MQFRLFGVALVENDGTADPTHGVCSCRLVDPQREGLTAQRRRVEQFHLDEFMIEEAPTKRSEQAVAEPGSTDHHNRLQVVRESAEFLPLKRCPLGAEPQDESPARLAFNGSFEPFEAGVIFLWKLVG